MRRAFPLAKSCRSTSQSILGHVHLCNTGRSIRQRSYSGHAGAPKGYAFVEFEEDEDASQAVDNLHLGQFYGKTIRVSFARIGQRQQAMTVHVLARRAGIFYCTFHASVCADLASVWEQEDYLKERTTANHPVELTDASQA